MYSLELDKYMRNTYAHYTLLQKYIGASRHRYKQLDIDTSLGCVLKNINREFTCWYTATFNIITSGGSYKIYV